jgi:hypothetical protein
MNKEEYNMKSIMTSIVTGLILATSVYTPPVTANDIITCESRHQRYNTCPIQSHGYVFLRRQTSKADCIQGVTWDYDQRSIWVDENCKGEFEIETRHHTSGHKDHTGKNALAAVAAIAIIAAVTTSSKDDKHNKYNDDDYYGSRHSSYVPGWMVGDFEGFNMEYDSEVTMHISSDGRMTARIDGTRVTGYVNDERLYVGYVEFYVDRAGNGFNTTQIGDSSNQVHYVRTR